MIQTAIDKSTVATRSNSLLLKKINGTMLIVR